MEQQKIQQYRQRLLEQKETLNNAVAQLKKEFIGIDQVIDQIADAITSWIYFPEMQDRPVIINLWGLTGTGKTSLVKRLVELINYTDRYFRFDLGESTSRYFDIQDSFKDIYESCDGEPFIIGLDEFQLARTIDEEQKEVDKASSRAIWDLLDCGKFDIIEFEYNLSWFGKLIKKLDLALSKGVEVKGGEVISNHNIYKELIQSDNNRVDDEDESVPTDKSKLYFISDDDLNTVFNLVDFLFLSKSDLREKLDELDGDATIDYLIYLYKKTMKPKTVDCTKSLVFVMGNLDEVYSMTRNFNPDINADEFHRQSTKITITQVKDALLTRFRSEQIARLGNVHIIYPAFNRKTFCDIIRLELAKISAKVFDTYHINMMFDDKMEQLIYDEGVYPTQGTRPLFTTIHQIVNTRLGKILNEVYINGYMADSVFLTTDDCESVKDNIALRIEFIKDGSIIHYIIDQQPLVLGKLRKEKLNDEQAIVAVHESGHAILSSILMRTIPESVLSVTADSGSDGFVLARPQWNYVSKKEVINRLAVLLGGLVAERIIFGEENITMGSGSDLNKATGLATHVLYSCGMGQTKAAYGNENMTDTPSIIFDDHRSGINEEARALLVKADELAEETLLEQKKLLIHLADYLSNKRSADKNKVREFLEKYVVNFDVQNIVEEKDAEHLFYRSHLKKLVQDLD